MPQIGPPYFSLNGTVKLTNLSLSLSCPVLKGRWPGAIADGILEPKLTTIQTDSCFQLTRIVKSGDEVVNPVPPTRTNSSRQCNSGKTKCLASSKTIAINHRAVPCDVCKRKTLIKCGDIAPKMYDRMINGTNLQWTCPGCVHYAGTNTATWILEDSQWKPSLFIWRPGD